MAKIPSRSPVVSAWERHEYLQIAGVRGELVQCPKPDKICRRDVLNNTDVLGPLIECVGVRPSINEIEPHVEEFFFRNRTQTKAQSWALRRLISVFSRTVKRPHVPREPAMRALYLVAGVPLPEGANPEIEHPTPGGSGEDPNAAAGENAADEGEEGWGDDMEEEGGEEEEIENDCEVDPETGVAMPNAEDPAADAPVNSGPSSSSRGDASLPAPFASYTAPAEKTEIPMVPTVVPSTNEGTVEKPNASDDPANVPPTGVDSKPDGKAMLAAEQKRLQTLLAIREAKIRLESLKAMRGTPVSPSPSPSPAGSVDNMDTLPMDEEMEFKDMHLASPPGEKLQIFGKRHSPPAVSEGTHTAQAATPEAMPEVGNKSNMMDGSSTSHAEVPKSEEAAAPALEKKDPSPFLSQEADSAPAEAVPEAEAPASTKTPDESKTDETPENGDKQETEDSAPADKEKPKNVPKAKMTRSKKLKGKEVSRSKAEEITPAEAKPEDTVSTNGLERAQHVEVENGQPALVPGKRRVEASTHDSKKAKREVKTKEEKIEHSKTQDSAPAEAAPKAEAPAAKTKDEYKTDETKNGKTAVAQDSAPAAVSKGKDENLTPKNLEKDFEKCDKEAEIAAKRPGVVDTLMPVSPTEQAAGQRVTDPENAPKRKGKGKGKGRGRGKGNGKNQAEAEVESSAEPPKKRTRKSKVDAENGTTPTGMSDKGNSNAGSGESNAEGVAKAAKAKAAAKGKAKAKAVAPKAKGRAKAKTSPKKPGKKPNAATLGKKAKIAGGGGPPDGGDDGDDGDDGQPEITPEQKATRARNSRKSSAYHKAYKAALKQGLDITEAKAKGKEAYHSTF
eukprot:s3978_g2.t1